MPTMCKVLLVTKFPDIVSFFFQVIKDERSDIESSSEEDDTALNSTKGIHNTSSNGANRVNGHAANGQWADE